MLKDFKAVMTPGFSLFTDYTKSVHIFNHFRKHLHGAYRQRIDMMTVPSICRNDHDPYDWHFDGEPKGGTVAVFS